MAGKSDSWENGLMLLMFNNTDYTLVGDAGGLRGSVGAGSLYVSLHTAAVEAGGLQTTNETAYTSYARATVARSGAGFTVTGNQVVNAAAVTFVAPTGSVGNPIVYWGLGTALSGGAGKLLYSGPLASVPIGFALGESTDDVVTIKNHALAVDDRIAFHALAGLALPTGIAEGTVYFVKTVPSVDTITISTTSGGSTVDITVDGNAIAYKILSYQPTISAVPQIAAGAMKIIED